MGRNVRLRWLIFVVGVYAAVCIVGGIYLADGTLHPGRRELTADEGAGVRAAVRAMNADLADVSITTSDGALLRGWLVRPERANGDAALVLHGLGDNRLGTSGYARMLLAHGYTVLMPDARGHGASGGEVVTYGLIERNDIRQWVEFLSAETHARCVYGMGESMGGAELLQSLAAGARFCAVVAESPFADFREIAYDRMGQPFGLGPWVGRTVLRPVVEMAFLRARWKYGLDMEQVSPEDAVRATSVPVLLIHGAVDGNIPVRHSVAMHVLAPQTVLWVVPGADHCGAMSAAPAEFESRVLGWFAGRPNSITTKDTKGQEGKTEMLAAH
jgi:pimeloyl-ACP methyl ester carboxylesterase